MSQISAIRTVRRLDERTEVKEIAGIVIEKGIPIPSRVTKAVAKVVMVLRAMDVGESFTSDRTEKDHRLRVERETGRKFVGRPVNLQKTKWRIWRTK